MALTPEQRSQRARLAAFTRWSKEDPAETARRGQEGLLRRFLDEVDPDRTLTESERSRRAKAARKAHMTRLAFNSAKARRRHTRSHRGRW